MKSRMAKLVFQSAFLAIGVIAVLASLGFFGYNYRKDFYVYFTNLSNYLCIGVMAVEFVETLRNKEDSYVTVLPKLKFVSVLSIMLTFFVFNFILANMPERHPASNYEISSVLCHAVIPVMFTLDWLLFYERKKVRWYYPLLSVIFPFVYGAFIYIRAFIPGIEKHTSVIYPYFFLNIKSQGIPKVVMWVSVMLAVYIVAGYLMYIIDHIVPCKSEKINDDGKGAQ